MMANFSLIIFSLLLIGINSESKNDDEPPKFESRKGFPSSKEFQSVNSTLLMTSALSGHLVPKDAVLSALPQSYVTFVTPAAQPKCTLRQFLRRYRTEDNVHLEDVLNDAFKAFLPLPSLLRCPFFTENLKTSRLHWHWTDSDNVLIPVTKSEQNALHCLLDGKGKLVIQDKDKPEVKSSVNPGDCLYLPPKRDVEWRLHGRVILVIVTWSGTQPSKEKCKDEKKKEKESQTLGHVTFGEDPSPDFFQLLALNTLSTYIEDYHLTTNCTKDVFLKRFMKKQLKKALLKWDDESQAVAEELFQELDTNKDGILSDIDVDTLNFEEINQLAGILEDRLADITDIAEDQEEEKPKNKSGPSAVADDIRANYEKELQALLEDGFNEILQEANIQGRVSFDKDGNPQISKTPKESTEEETSNSKPTEEAKETTEKSSSTPTNAEQLKHKEEL